ncbi:MAG TPA: ammonium transporter [Thermoanaerobaculia bacterium]|nr:ammonium transporter [Thermoanaerobaculia bacterium]
MHRPRRLPSCLALAALLALAGPTSPLHAQDGGVDPADTSWVLVSTALVLLMTPGLAFFYGGLVRRKNVLSILMQCFLCMSLMTVLWVAVGFSLAFAPDALGGIVGGLDYAFLRGVGFEAWDGTTIPAQLFMLFQAMFAIITPALMVGAFAERMRFSAMCWFSSLWLLLVYCPVAHWVWGGAEGFFGLGSDGALDFAGGTVVHINAGVAALVAAILLGRRQGYPSATSPPHNLPFAVLGTGLLWFGWFGFNAGSALAAGASAVNAMVTTHLAAAAAALTWGAIEWVRHDRPTVLGVITGAVAGLVAITPACGSVDALGALAVGVGASLASYLAVAWVKTRLGYDDSLDVFGVHGVAGVWGALATGLFATAATPGNDTNGLFHGNPMQALIQLEAVVFTLVWSGVVSLALLKLISWAVPLRVGHDDERIGLDLTAHREAAYTIVE